MTAESRFNLWKDYWNKYMALIQPTSSSSSSPSQNGQGTTGSVGTLPADRGPPDSDEKAPLLVKWKSCGVLGDSLDVGPNGKKNKQQKLDSYFSKK